MNPARFFIRNPVPATMLTWAVVLGGIAAALSIRREFFPQMDPDTVVLTLAYPGASAEEVERSLARKLEDAAADLDDVEEITTLAFEGGGTLRVKFAEGSNLEKRKDELRDKIDGLKDLPPEAERTSMADMEMVLPVIQLSLSGQADPETLKRAGREVEEDLRSFSGMGRIFVEGAKDYEFRVEVDRSALLRLGIPITRVADAIGAWMEEVPGGLLRGRDEQMALRAKGVEERADQIREIVIGAGPDGHSWRVGDIATVEEGYADSDYMLTYNGDPAVLVTVMKTGSQDALDMAEFIRGYAAGRRGEPSGAGLLASIFGSPRTEGYEKGKARGPLPIRFEAHNDLARLIDGRLELLTGNAVQGAILVYLALLLGVSPRAAWWVMVGIVLSLLGTVFLMWALGTTINLLSMFGLLLVLGMLADDAIVFSESIETCALRDGLPPVEAAERGTRLVLLPVLASVATTVVAFLPLAFVQGQIGDMMEVLPVVVSVALGVSVMEAMFLLPAHMAHSLRRSQSAGGGSIRRLLRRWDEIRDGRLWPWLEHRYGRIADACISHRYVTVSAAVALLIVSLGLVAGGRLPFSFLPTDDSESVVVSLRMPLGTSLEGTRRVGGRLEAAATAQPDVKAITSIYGSVMDWNSGLASGAGGNLAQFFIELQAVESRERTSGEVIAAIQRTLGQVPEADDITFSEITGGPAGADIAMEVRGEDIGELRAVADEIVAELAAFDGVMSAGDDDYPSQPEVQVKLRPDAAGLGLSPLDVAMQVRGAIHGIDAHALSADREDIDVRVRLDDASRERVTAARDMWIVSPAGRPVPLAQVASVTEGEGPSSLRRVDRLSAIQVTADTEPGTSPEEVIFAVSPRIDLIRAAHPGVSIDMAGKQEDREDAFATIPYAALAALLSMYAIIAWMFGSYTQPFAVMSAIPFGIIGAIWGHLFLGYDLTFLSLIGLVALAGVVVNNSIVMVDFANGYLREGRPFREALVAAGERRLRAVLLTSLTTVAGLSPLILEQSFQARFLIPMAISLCGGLLSATLLTLLLLPAVLAIQADIRERLVRIFFHPAPAA